MKVPAILLLAGLVSGAPFTKVSAGTPSPSAAPLQSPAALNFGDDDLDQNLTGKVSSILDLCKKIKPGMKRAEVEKLFTEDGGLQSFTIERYVCRKCPVVKIDIKFTHANPKKDGDNQQPADIVSEVSKPYLEPQYYD